MAASCDAGHISVESLSVVLPHVQVCVDALACRTQSDGWAQVVYCTKNSKFNLTFDVNF